ncbi:hypothetical protein, partial [Blautia sp. OF11-22]|uniref:hypothetical protein n=1 Tax=Blautia sp. OF11-22 TaxID=2292982 RepID=UPI001A9A8FF2
LKNCRITVEKLNQGKAQCQPSGWHIFFGRTSYLPYTLVLQDRTKMNHKKSNGGGECYEKGKVCVFITEKPYSG